MGERGDQRLALLRGRDGQFEIPEGSLEGGGGIETFGTDGGEKFGDPFAAACTGTASLCLKLPIPEDARERRRSHKHRQRGDHEPAVGAVRSVASAALVLQVAAVYLGAGLSKCNPTWFAGDALAHALSIHDHGTSLGMLLGTTPWIARPLQWGVLLGEIGLPLILIALPSPHVRGGLVALAIAFHATIWLTPPQRPAT